MQKKTGPPSIAVHFIQPKQTDACHVQTRVDSQNHKPLRFESQVGGDLGGESSAPSSISATMGPRLLRPPLRRWEEEGTPTLRLCCVGRIGVGFLGVAASVAGTAPHRNKMSMFFHHLGGAPFHSVGSSRLGCVVVFGSDSLSIWW